MHTFLERRDAIECISMAIGIKAGAFGNPSLDYKPINESCERLLVAMRNMSFPYAEENGTATVRSKDQYDLMFEMLRKWKEEEGDLDTGSSSSSC